MLSAENEGKGPWTCDARVRPLPGRQNRELTGPVHLDEPQQDQPDSSSSLFPEAHDLSLTLALQIDVVNSGSPLRLTSMVAPRQLRKVSDDLYVRGGRCGVFSEVVVTRY